MSAGEKEVPPKPALRVPDAVVLECERQVSDTALPLPHRYRAGAFMCMALGGVRWDTVQWTTAVALQADAVMFDSAREKVQGQGSHKWGAPRIGPGGTDWGAAFYDVWTQVERPAGCDWLLPAAKCPRGQRFTLDTPFDLSKKATFNSALMMFRCLLRGPGLNFDMAESQKYTFHSLRAWLDTGLRQAGFSEDDCTLALHWAKNSTMPRLYDRASITSEVAVKARLMAGYQTGWRQVENGTLPQHFEAGMPPPGQQSRKRPRTPASESTAPAGATIAPKVARHSEKSGTTVGQSTVKNAKASKAEKRARRQAREDRRAAKAARKAAKAATQAPALPEQGAALESHPEPPALEERQRLYAELFPGQAW